MGNRQGPTIFLLVLGLVATEVAANGKSGGGGGCGHGGAEHSYTSGIGFSSASGSGTGLNSGASSHGGIPNNFGFGRSNGLPNVDQVANIQEPPPWNTIGQVITIFSQWGRLHRSIRLSNVCSIFQMAGKAK
jgi:hypothetical protein